MGKVKFKPKSYIGKWSLGLIILSPLLFYISINVPPLLEDPLTSGGIIYGSAFFCGIIGILRKKDYSVLVILSTLIGFFILLFVLQQALFPSLIDFK
ncbi:hypothetical protein [Maribellus mangrovi]|uniref:hypothetical protein n=1 Tax=Maribellus mangrovi TaxID=3133146 RepID=UPI0030EEE82E